MGVYWRGLLSSYRHKDRVELLDKDHVAQKAENTYSLALYRSLLTPDLMSNGT